jgi:hypothetical protein
MPEPGSDRSPLFSEPFLSCRRTAPVCPVVRIVRDGALLCLTKAFGNCITIPDILLQERIGNQEELNDQ